MIEIFGKNTSINVRKVLCFLELTKTPYKYNKDVTIDEINSLNPNGLVPILKDDDFILWESNSILRYIANKFDITEYYPVESKERAMVDKWLDWQASDFNSSWVYAFQSIVRKSKEHQDTKFIEQSKQKWNKCISIINDQLKSSKYISSDELSIADVVIAVSLNRWYLCIGEKDLFKYVDKYFDRLSKLDGFNEILNNGIA